MSETGKNPSETTGENPAYEQWKDLENKLTIEAVRESINAGRQKAGMAPRTDFKDYPLENQPKEEEQNGVDFWRDELTKAENEYKAKSEEEALDRWKVFYEGLEGEQAAADAHEKEFLDAHERELAEAHARELAEAEAAEAQEAQLKPLFAINADFTHDKKSSQEI